MSSKAAEMKGLDSQQRRTREKMAENKRRRIKSAQRWRAAKATVRSKKRSGKL